MPIPDRPSRRTRRRALVIAPVIALAAGVMWWRATAHPSFPDALADPPSTVSWQQAFADHHITLPASARNLAYTASTDLDGYPMAARLSIDCGDVGWFVQTNNLTQMLHYYNLSNADVYTFAQFHGWQPGTGDTSWYQRPIDPDPDLEAMIEQTGAGDSQVCTVYLSAITA